MLFGIGLFLVGFALGIVLVYFLDAAFYCSHERPEGDE